MTDNWLNTKAGMRFANGTIPKLTAAIDRMSEALEKYPIWDSPPCETYSYSNDEEEELNAVPSEWTRRQQQVSEIQRVLRWEPSELEILLYRALSQLYASGTGTEKECEEAVDEAFAALQTASHDFRNVLASHTFVSIEDRTDDNPQRIDWEPTAKMFRRIYGKSF